jgi:hypothetical protein
VAPLAEELVEEWLNRKGYFTIRGIKVGVHEMDILADPCTGHQFTATDVGTRILQAACEQGLTWSSHVEDDLAVVARVEQFKRDVAAGRVKIRTPEEIAAEEEARRAAEIMKNTEGRQYEPSDSPAAQQILAARYRHEARQCKQATAA